ncbi:TonB-dependent receptor [hydrothermal vent metagenome]|uniref:TonB-dependent receptor n=1 Tax=hydrothermal vent metagenome TaxID=652676 RepID=A0A3B0UK06_9ZZZZ
MVKPIFSIVLVAISALHVYSQQITGIILNAKNNQPVPNASISILNTSNGTSTSKDGIFIFSQKHANTTRIRVSCIGFESKEVNLKDYRPSHIEIKLHPVSFQLNNEIVVTASRNELISFKTPDAISVLSKQDIQTNAPRSMAEALIGVTGVWMQKTNHGGGSPFIRGLTGNQTLILIDGIRLNNSAFRYGPNQYFNTIGLFTVRQVEVIRGKGSVLYGSDALGGVINVITKSPEFKTGKPQLAGLTDGKLMSHGMEQSVAGQLAYQAANFSILGTASFKNFGDLYAGGDLGKEAPSGYNENGLSLKAKYKISNNWLITSAFQQLRQNDVPRFDQVTQRGYQRYSFDPQIHRLMYARAINSGGNKFFRSIKLTVSNQLSDETRIIQKDGDPVLKKEHDVVKSFGMAADIYSTFTKRWAAITGIEYYRDKINSSKIEINTVTNTTEKKRGLYPDGSISSNLAVFSKHTYELGKISIGFGGRFNLVVLNIFDEQFGNVELKPSSLVGNFSLQYYLNNTSQVILSANSAFRAPNINDISSFGLFDYGIEIPSDKLSPEKAYTFEAGFKKRAESFSFSLFAFNTMLKNQIVRVKSRFNGSKYIDGERVYKKANTAKSNIMGVETESGIQFNKHISITNNLTWLYGKDLTKNTPMRRIPPLNGKLALRYSKSSFFCETDFLFATKQDRLSSGDIDDHRIPDGGTPGWSILNTKLGYVWRNFSVNSGIQNIFNKAYRAHGSGVDGYGRYVWMSFLYRFKI